MTNKTILEQFRENKCTGYACNHETAEDHYIVFESDLTTIKEQMLEAVGEDKCKHEFNSFEGLCRKKRCGVNRTQAPVDHGYNQAKAEIRAAITNKFGE